MIGTFCATCTKTGYPCAFHFHLKENFQKFFTNSLVNSELIALKIIYLTPYYTFIPNFCGSHIFILPQILTILGCSSWFISGILSLICIQHSTQSVQNHPAEKIHLESVRQVQRANSCLFVSIRFNIPSELKLYTPIHKILNYFYCFTRSKLRNS